MPLAAVAAAVLALALGPIAVTGAIVCSCAGGPSPSLNLEKEAEEAT